MRVCVSNMSRETCVHRAFGAAVVVIEAPMFCQHFEWADAITKFVDNRPYFMRAAIYVV